MNRMFQVIVAGGMSLTGYACGSNVVAANAGATSGGVGGFPEETGVSQTTVTVGAGGAGGSFPQEGAGGSPGAGGAGGTFNTASSTSSGFGGFPQEGPDAGLADSGAADVTTDGCFACETPIPK